jgi:TonB family protein
MHRSAFLISVALLSGCASSQHPRYALTYQIAGLPTTFDEFSVERAHRANANDDQLLVTQRTFDTPIKLLSAPQPVMPASDIEDRVVGEVVVEILFAEDGTFEKMTVVRSTRESLSRAVLDAVSRWKITPPVRSGKPAKFTARQAFKFQSAL